MDPIIEMLRDESNAIEALTARREELKRKLEEHRSGNISEEEFEKLSAERKDIEKELALRTKRREELTAAAEKNKDQGEGRGIYMFDNKDLRSIDILRYDMYAPENAAIRKAFEERAAAFSKEKRMKISAGDIKSVLDGNKRSILSTSSGIAKPTRVGGIENPLNQVITIVDQVDTVDMQGAGAYKVSFVKTVSVASEKEEGKAQTESSPTYGTVTISPKNIAVTSYISREVEKTTPLNYLEKVTQTSMDALKVKLAQEIVTAIKTGTDDDSAAMYQTLEASAANGMLSGTAGAINEKTLRQIVMNYGGDANIYGNAVLYLNKNDLIAFGDVRGTSEKRAVYEITPNGDNPNIGIIKDGGLSVPYCIVPTLTAHNGTKQTTSAVQTMIYGSPLNFEEAIFSDFGVQVSSEYKFAEGLLTVMGEVMAGGSVKVKNGFLVVTIPKTAA